MDRFAVTPQPTPNPNAMKFTANRPINPGPTRTYYNAGAAEADPVAKRLFALGGVTGVMLVRDFCSVNQDGTRDWDELAPAVIAILSEAFGGASS